MRGFWNDPDGISITDFLALLFSAAYLGVLGLAVTRMIAGELADQDIDLLQVLTWPTLTILGGYFGGQMLGRLQGSLKRQPGMDPMQMGMGGMMGGYGYGGGYGMAGPVAMIDPRNPQPVMTMDDMERDPGEVGLSGS